MAKYCNLRRIRHCKPHLSPMNPSLFCAAHTEARSRSRTVYLKHEYKGCANRLTSPIREYDKELKLAMPQLVDLLHENSLWTMASPLLSSYHCDNSVPWMRIRAMLTGAQCPGLHTMASNLLEAAKYGTPKADKHHLKIELWASCGCPPTLKLSHLILHKETEQTKKQ